MRPPTRHGRLRLALAAAAALAVVATACSPDDPAAEAEPDPTTTTGGPTTTTTTVPPGPLDLYAHTRAGMLHPSVRDIPPRVYVPNELGDTVSVIDPTTYRKIDELPMGREPHHVVNSWDMQTLYILITEGDALVPIDPWTGRTGPWIPVIDPYNLYFTPDGKLALVIAERFFRIDLRDPRTWEVIQEIPIPCDGVNHGDFSADGRIFYASCESLYRREPGAIVKLDLERREVIGKTILGGSAVDVRTAPDASVLFVANQGRHGVSVVDPETLTEIEFIPTGRGAHGLYFSRDSKRMFVSNRLGGSVSVVDVATRKVIDTWPVPNGSPDMGSLSTDGRELWLSGRHHNEVYVIDTETGALLHRIRVGRGPHGLVYTPQPGRFSLGHTGNFR